MAQQRAEQRQLAVFGHWVDAVHDARRGLLMADDDLHRIAQDRAREIENRRRHRRGEHHSLPLARQQREDTPNIREKPHVQHAIGLVEHQDLELREIDVAEALVVEQPAGCGDDDLGARP